jgi:hypothetical protein
MLPSSDVHLGFEDMFAERQLHIKALHKNKAVKSLTLIIFVFCPVYKACHEVPFVFVEGETCFLYLEVVE